MNELEYQQRAEHWLSTAERILEEADCNPPLEVEYQQGVLTLVKVGKTWLINKHAPTQQLWLASPISGGLHFSYNETAKTWVLADGRTLDTILARELGVPER